MLPDPRETPTLPVPVAGKLFGWGRSLSYSEAKRYLATNGTEGLPVIASGGRKLCCPTAEILRKLGIAAEGSADPPPEGSSA